MAILLTCSVELDGWVLLRAGAQVFSNHVAVSGRGRSQNFCKQPCHLLLSFCCLDANTRTGRRLLGVSKGTSSNCMRAASGLSTEKFRVTAQNNIVPTALPRSDFEGADSRYLCGVAGWVAGAAQVLPIFPSDRHQAARASIVITAAHAEESERFRGISGAEAADSAVQAGWPVLAVAEADDAPNLAQVAP